MANECKHETVLKILQGNGDDYWQCLVLHYKPNGTRAPACISCPDCHQYVDWEEQAAMMSALEDSDAP